MALITWNQSYSVEIPTIDEQHKTLVELINKLHDARLAGKGADALGLILTELIRYTQTHFAHEERLMRLYNYPDYEGHKKLHNDLVGKVLEVKSKFDAGEKALSGEVFDFLKDWLVNHIQGTDRKYTPFLKQKGVA